MLNVFLMDNDFQGVALGRLSPWARASWIENCDRNHVGAEFAALDIEHPVRTRYPLVLQTPRSNAPQ